MSYSYIKNVFPQYESSIINTQKLYNNLNYNTNYNETKNILAYDENEFSKFKKDLINKSEEYQLPQTKIIEKMTNEEPKHQEPHNQNHQIQSKNQCDGNLNHIMNCVRCKNIITKQLNINNDRIRNEELLELVSYIIFSIFILLLVDFIKKI